MPAGTEALADAFPEGSDTRRAAVAALGHQLHTRMLHVNVVPSSAMLGTALLPAAVFAAIAQSEGVRSRSKSSLLLCHDRSGWLLAPRLRAYTDFVSYLALSASV